MEPRDIPERAMFELPSSCGPSFVDQKWLLGHRPLLAAGLIVRESANKTSASIV